MPSGVDRVTWPSTRIRLSTPVSSLIFSLGMVRCNRTLRVRILYYLGSF